MLVAAMEQAAVRSQNITNHNKSLTIQLVVVRNDNNGVRELRIC
jgi:hypothetical protein